MAIIYDRIKKIANIRKMSLRQVALKSGLKSDNAIYRYKQGIKPRKPTLEAIAKTLHTTAEYLSGKSDEWKIKEKPDSPAHVDLEKDPVVLSYGGKPVSKDEMKIIKEILARFKKDGNNG